MTRAHLHRWTRWHETRRAAVWTDRTLPAGALAHGTAWTAGRSCTVAGCRARQAHLARRVALLVDLPGRAL